MCLLGQTIGIEEQCSFTFAFYSFWNVGLVLILKGTVAIESCFSDVSSIWVFLCLVIVGTMDEH